LPSLVAAHTDGYANTVRRLADDRALRDDLRRSLRTTMEASAVCDGSRFASSREAAHRTMWRNWCSERASGQGEA
jgi:predicted O-linked N-acetylglucosamine transferase (SPINDLY family)